MGQYSKKYPDAIAPIFQLFGKCVGGDARIQPPWEIPDKIVIKCAVLGTIWDREQNPYQPLTTEDTVREAIDAIDAGACSIHLHVRDKDGNISTDRALYREVVDPLRKKYGDKVHFDGESAFGETFEDAMAPAAEGLFESSAVNTTTMFLGETFFCFPPTYLQALTKELQALGRKPSIAVYNTCDVETADRYLIQTGILKPPFEWIIVPGIVGTAPMPNAVAMCESLLEFIWRIREVDPAKNPFIVVSPGGRASNYLTALSIILGLHVRVGMEDTIWRYPHKDELLKGNKQLVEETVTMARILGREPATAADYRRFVGLKK